MTRKDQFYTPGKIFLSNTKKKQNLFKTKGPSTYDVRTQPFKSKLEHPSANFISSSAREPIIEVIFIDLLFSIILLFFSKRILLVQLHMMFHLRIKH